MSKFAILLNGPSCSGKDIAAKHFSEKHGFKHCEFKAKLFDLTKCIYSVDNAIWDMLYTRENKELPTHFLDGLSPRQALIKVSEEVIKPNFSKDYFGVSAAKALAEGFNIFSDSGFLEELIPVQEAVGEDNLLVIRIHRPGYTFEGDSRSYLPTDSCKWVVDVHNDGTEAEYILKLEEKISWWIRQITIVSDMLWT